MRARSGEGTAPARPRLLTASASIATSPSQLPPRSSRLAFLLPVLLPFLFPVRPPVPPPGSSSRLLLESRSGAGPGHLPGAPLRPQPGHIRLPREPNSRCHTMDEGGEESESTEATDTVS